VSLVAPSDLGAPSRFRNWREKQGWALEQILHAPTRFAVGALPTGLGKMLVAVCRSLAMDERAVILTSTKGLQDQYTEQFQSGRSAVWDLRGLRNYPCRALPHGRCDEGPCMDGQPCRYLADGCTYFDRLREAQYQPRVVTNYAMWFALRRSDRNIGDRPLLLLDEAHDVDSILSAAVGTRFAGDEVEFPQHPGFEMEQWKEWAKAKLQDVDRLLLSAFMPPQERRDLRDLKRRFEAIIGSSSDWVVDQQEDAWAFEPLWPAAYAESWLYRGAQSVVMLSATITPKTLQYLGLAPADYTFVETPSPFDPARRPIYHYAPEPQLRVTHKMTESDVGNWVTRIDQVIRGRLDRKGIIHTVSYARARELMKRSSFRQHMLTHTSSRATQRTVEEFKRSAAPCILVSPAVHTGYDFPGRECEYTIVAKVPFPDTRAGAAKARNTADPDWGAYRAATTLVQMTGRGMRSASDRNECFVVDDTIAWVKHKYRAFFPAWWLAAYKRVGLMPPPAERV
jgi:Rad3-related DNA helicase